MGRGWGSFREDKAQITNVTVQIKGHKQSKRSSRRKRQRRRQMFRVTRRKDRRGKKRKEEWEWD